MRRYGQVRVASGLLEGSQLLEAAVTPASSTQATVRVDVLPEAPHVDQAPVIHW